MADKDAGKKKPKKPLDDSIPVGRKITRDDIQGKLKAIDAEVNATTEAAKPKLLAGAVALAAVVVLLAFVLGKRSGKKKTTLVEIRRV